MHGFALKTCHYQNVFFCLQNQKKYICNYSEFTLKYAVFSNITRFFWRNIEKKRFEGVKTALNAGFIKKIPQKTARQAINPKNRRDRKIVAKSAKCQRLLSLFFELIRNKSFSILGVLISLVFLKFFTDNLSLE
jgi:hypothetical protein